MRRVPAIGKSRIELSPPYVDVAIRRWQAFTGHEATLLASRQTFEAVIEERTADTSLTDTTKENA
jgi:hypothetical protein